MNILWKYAIDLLYLLVAVIVIITFTERGFIKSLFRSGRLVFAGLICYLAGPSVGTLLYDRWIYNGIFSWVFARVDTFLHNAAAAVNFDGMLDSLPALVKQLVDVEALRESYRLSEGDLLEMANNFSAAAAKPFASLISNLLAYVIVFIVAMVLLFILFKVLDVIFSLPILSTINRVLGFVFGVLAATFLLAAISYLLGLVVGVFGSSDALAALTNSSFCFRLFDRIAIFSLF